MSDAFNLRSFVENQVEKFAVPATSLVDRFRQTVDNLKLPFSSTAPSEQDTLLLTTADTSLSLTPLESISSSSTSSIASPIRPHEARLISKTAPNSIANMKLSVDDSTSRRAPLRRHVSDSNRADETPPGRTVFHNNPPVDISVLLTRNYLEASQSADRSRSLIRQSTEATCTFPIRRHIRRLESVEIPGLNGVKAIRYIMDDLGKLEPHLYQKQTSLHDASSETGHITFTLFYNQASASLIVSILSVTELPYRNANSKTLPNPFIKLMLLPDRRKKLQTKLYKHTQAVQFNETFTFPLAFEDLQKRVLLLSVYDFRRSSKRNLIGTLKIEDIHSVANLTSYDVAFTRQILPGTESDPDLGELTISLCYLPNAKRVTVTIVKATSLKPMDITGKSDPYVKVLLLINGKRLRKKKTSVLCNTLNPIYNECLEFDLSNDELRQADLIFKVIDYDRVGLNELIGCMGIGIHFDGMNRSHWYQMLEHPHVAITQNYHLRETVPHLMCTDSNSTQSKR